MPFDPDKYLADKQDSFNPDEYLAESPSNIAQELPQEEPGYLETIAHQAPQGLTFGLSDELRGLVNSPAGAGKEFLNKFLADNNQYSDSDVENYKSDRDKERAILKSTQEANPVTSILSQLTGGLIPGGLVAKGVQAAAGAGTALTGLQTAARVGALEGGLYGAGQSDAGSATGMAKDSTIGAGLGGTLGAVTGQMGRFLGGNKADIASGALPKGTVENAGAIKDFTNSKLGSRVKGFFKAGQEGIDLSSEAAELARGKAMKESAGDILDVAQEKAQTVGKAIGKKVEEAGAFTPESVEKVLTQLPQDVQQEVMSVLPGKITKASDAPIALQKELEATTDSIQKVISANPEETVKSMQKIAYDVIDPTMLDGELQYSAVGKRVSDNIKKSLQDNPEQTLSDLYNTIVKGEAPSLELDDLFQQLKFKAAVNKLAKEAQVSTGEVPEAIQTLQALLDKKSALKKAVNQFSKKEIQAPDEIVKTIVKSLDESHIAASDRVPAQKLKDVISDYVQADGTVAPEKTAEFRDALNHFRTKTDSFKIGNLAKQLEKEIGTFRRNAAGELSEQYHDIKSFAKLLKIDTDGMTENEIKNAVAPRFAKFVAKSESTANLDSGMMQDLVDKFVEAQGNDPKIAKALAEISQAAKWSELHKVKSGSTGSMFNDGVNRLLFAFPLETAGQVSANPLIKSITKTTANSSEKLLNLPAAGWRSVSAKLSGISPSMSKMANTMAETTDEGKKRAILNSLNQMPSFRKAIENLSGNKEE